MPVCLLNKKGFICFANDDFNELINVSISTDFPYIGRYLDHKSSSKIRKLLDRPRDVDDDKLIHTFNCVWDVACLRNDKANMVFTWTLSGKASNSVFLLCGRYVMCKLVNTNGVNYTFHSFKEYLESRKDTIVHQISEEDIPKEDSSNVQKYRAALQRKHSLGPTMRISDDESALSMQVMANWNNFSSRVKRVQPKAAV